LRVDVQLRQPPTHLAQPGRVLVLERDFERARTLAEAHTTVIFTIRTGNAGTYRWQCFVPCAAGFILGFGGPMQSVGYMDGYLNVVA